MTSMKENFIAALAVGAFISVVLMVADPYVNFALLSLQMPGVSAAYLFWGAIGGPASIGIAICWVVNALVYGAGAFTVLAALGLAKRPVTR